PSASWQRWVEQGCPAREDISRRRAGRLGGCRCTAGRCQPCRPPGRLWRPWWVAFTERDDGTGLRGRRYRRVAVVTIAGHGPHWMPDDELARKVEDKWVEIAPLVDRLMDRLADPNEFP